MTWRDDNGLSLTELLVASMLLVIVLGAVYLGISYAFSAQGVAEDQARIAKEITSPLNMMDISFSQSIPVAGFTYNAYSATARMPADYLPGQTIEHVYAATTDGKLTKSVYDVIGASKTLRESYVLSTLNVNQAKGQPLFRYYASGTTTSSVNTADKLVIEVMISDAGKEYSDSRTIYLRNR